MEFTERSMAVQLHIVGAGSIGLLLGAKLADIGANVTLWARTKEQAIAIDDAGIQLYSSEGSAARTVKVRGEWIEEAGRLRQSQEADAGGFRWIIVTVKQNHLSGELLSRLTDLAAPLPSDSYEAGSDTHSAVISLQNGIGHIDKLGTALNGIPLYAAVTTAGARRTGPCTVVHTGEGELWLGQIDEIRRISDERLEYEQKMLLNALQTAGFASFLSNDSKEMLDRIYNKLLVNAVVNPLTAIFNVKNGDLPKNKMRRALMRAVYEESESILIKAGMSSIDNGWERVIDVCRRTGSNVSSMLSDVRSGRQTEIHAINGGITELAQRHLMSAPINLALIALVQALHAKPHPYPEE